MPTENFFEKIKTEIHGKVKGKVVDFYENTKDILIKTINYFTNINIIFSDSNNINSICYSSILENIKIENDNDDFIKYKKLNFVNLINDNNYFINSLHFNYIKWIYLLFNYFVNINILFVDFIPLNIIEIFKFFENTNVKFEIITNDKTNKNIIEIIQKFLDKKENENLKVIINKNYDSKLGIVNNLIEKYKESLFDDQLIFFNYISAINNNIDLTPEQINFVDGLYYFFNIKPIFLNTLWDISYEGQTGIDLFINEGIRLSTRKKY